MYLQNTSFKQNQAKFLEEQKKNFQIVDDLK